MFRYCDPKLTNAHTELSFVDRSTNMCQIYLNYLSAVGMKVAYAGLKVFKLLNPSGSLACVKQLPDLIACNFWRVRQHRLKPL